MKHKLEEQMQVYQLDKYRTRLAFERAADSYDGAALLQREVGSRMVERLDYIRMNPEHIIDIGSGTGFISNLLQKNYPGARLLSLDFAHTMLYKARHRQSLLKRFFSKQRYICGDVDFLPLRENCMDMAISGLTLQWCNQLDHTFNELFRILRPGGMLMFTTFGPDTLKELRASWQAVDGFTHVNAFTDMHDIGDALLRSGFADPVMDVEKIKVTYEDVYKLMGDLKAIGAQNFTAGRVRSLTGKTRLRKMISAYEGFRENGVLPATYEVIYGHCWIPAADSTAKRAQPAGTVTIPLTQLKRSNTRKQL